MSGIFQTINRLYIFYIFSLINIFFPFLDLNLFDSNYVLKLKPKVSDSEQQETIVGLSKRLLPNHFQLFELIVDRTFTKDKYLDRFRIKAFNNKIVQIKGTTGVSVASGLYYYLKYVANCSVSWSGNHLFNFDQVGIPIPLNTIEIDIKEKYFLKQLIYTIFIILIFLDYAIIKILALRRIQMYGGIGIDGKRKLIGWHCMELICH